MPSTWIRRDNSGPKSSHAAARLSVAGSCTASISGKGLFSRHRPGGGGKSRQSHRETASGLT
jgi:hypothetical protein